MMNRFGNSISYATTQRYLTTVANDISEIEEREGIFIQTNVISGHFTRYALDYLNIHSDTKDGGSLDATTNIIYQYRERPIIGQAGMVPRQLTINAPEKFVPVNSKIIKKSFCQPIRPLSSHAAFEFHHTVWKADEYNIHTCQS